MAVPPTEISRTQGPSEPGFPALLPTYRLSKYDSTNARGPDMNFHRVSHPLHGSQPSTVTESTHANREPVLGASPRKVAGRGVVI